MTESSHSIPDLQAALRRAWSPASARQWTAANPVAGQCNVTALVVQDRLGGEILKTDLPGGAHFYNRIDGARIDLTAEQFGEPIAYRDTRSDRAELLAATDLAEYAALAGHLAEIDREGERDG